MFASSVAVFTLGIAGQACTAALAFRAPTPTPEAARTTWDLYLVLLGASNLLTIILGVTAAIAIAQSRVYPVGSRSVRESLRSLTWERPSHGRRSGAFSPTGVFSLLAPILYLAWVLAVSVVLLREQSADA
jgi:hypothetical protein